MYIVRFWLALVDGQRCLVIQIGQHRLDSFFGGCGMDWSWYPMGECGSNLDFDLGERDLVYGGEGDRGDGYCDSYVLFRGAGGGGMK